MYTPRCSKPSCRKKTTDPTGRCHHHRHLPDQLGRVAKIGQNEYGGVNYSHWVPQAEVAATDRENLHPHDPTKLAAALEGVMEDPDWTYAEAAAWVAAMGWRQNVYDAPTAQVAQEVFAETEYEGERCTGSDIVAALQAYGFKRTEPSAAEQWSALQDLGMTNFDGLEDTHVAYYEMGQTHTSLAIDSAWENWADLQRDTPGWRHEGLIEEVNLVEQVWGAIDASEYHTEEMVKQMKQMVADRIVQNRSDNWTY